MRAPRGRRRIALQVAALWVAAFLAGASAVSAVWPHSAVHAQTISLIHRSHTVSVGDRQSEVAGMLAGHYYQRVDAAMLARTPVASLATVLRDPYTQYLDPARLAAFQRGDTGRYAGIGVHATLVGADVVLDRVTAAGPAAAAGLHPGDIVISANGHRLRGLDLERALKRIRGPIGTTVALQIRRGRQTLTLVLRRAEVAAQIVSHRVLTVAGHPVGYIQVLEFTSGVGQQTREAMRDLKARGVPEVVLDLRHNGGGLVDEAVALTAVLTPVGTPVFIESGRHIARTTYRTHTDPADTVTPLAVLVDDQTASAAEIVTGALRDAGRATVIGTRTFGKGVIQDVVPLDGGGALKYTMAEYLTPSGQHVNRVGITPGVTVETPIVRGEADSALDAAVRTLARSRAGR